jgi:hypothetical protein
VSFRSLYASPQLPLWWRLVLFAADHDGTPLARGQLRDALDPERLTRTSDISRAIYRAKKAGMLEDDSRSCLLRFRQNRAA